MWLILNAVETRLQLATEYNPSTASVQIKLN